MSTKLLEKPEVNIDKETTDDKPKFFHYVKKNQIAESAVLGNFVEALCGERFPVTKVPNPNSSICPECKEIYSQLKI